jgi:hypothetical protein
MIVRNVDGILKLIGNIHDENEFVRLNPTGGFMQVDNLPYCRYGNYKMDGDEIVVDTDKEAEVARLQYKIDRSYPSVKEQLDMLWHAIDTNTLDKTSEFYTSLKAVKDLTPKPE